MHHRYHDIQDLTDVKLIPIEYRYDHTLRYRQGDVLKP